MLLHEMLAAAAHRAPERPALVTDAGVVTFAGLLARVEAVASGIGRLTLDGDRVAILAENRAEYVECYYAVPAAGRVLVPLNHRLHREEWLGALSRSGARVMIADPELLDRLGADAARAAGVTTIVGLDGAEGDAAGDTAYAELDESFEPPVGPSKGDVAWLVGTSGTTGTPKLAMLTHAGLQAAVIATLAARPVGRDDTLLTPFPLCHVAGYNVLVLHHAARPIVVMRRFDVDRLLELVGEHAVTMLSVAPTMIAMLLDDPRRDEVDAVLCGVRTIGYGASAIPAPVLRAAVERWDCDLSQGYGMTELSGNAVFLGPGDHRAAAAGDRRLLEAAGRPAPEVEVRLDPATAEILVRAPQEMAGYWEDPDATAMAFAGGWLHTGDVGRLDDDGLLTVVDRLKDVIVSGGENIASREVETVLHTHPGVADVAVIGLPDARWGERVTAVVVARDGASVSEAELVALARSHLAGFKTPRTVLFVDVLPRNAAGKVLKQQLRENLRVSAVLPVTEDDVETFWTDGVVCLRGALDAADVAAMAAPVDAALAGDESADLSEMGRALAASGEAVLTDGASRGRFVSGVDHWRTRPEFRAFAADSPLPALVGTLLRSAKINLYEDSVLVKEPGALERTAWHQDLSYFHVEGEQLCTTWCPLDPVGPDTGAVRYARGSHRWDAVYRPNLFVSEMPIPGTEGELVPDVDAIEGAEILTFATEPGDVVVHHARTLHAAGGNRSATVRRRAISVRYCGDDARVHVRAGAPRKPYQHAVVDGTVPDSPDCPVVWRAGT